MYKDYKNLKRAVAYSTSEKCSDFDTKKPSSYYEVVCAISGGGSSGSGGSTVIATDC